MTVWNSALCLADVMAVVEKCEEEWNQNSPFNSMCKLEVVVSKSSGRDGIRWSFKVLGVSFGLPHVILPKLLRAA